MINKNVYLFLQEQALEHISQEDIVELFCEFDDDYSNICRKYNDNIQTKFTYIQRLYYGYSLRINRTAFCKEATENKMKQEEISNLFDTFAKKYYSCH